ncbi:MAG: hypothetical protein ABIH48_00580 [Candidatus Falkowbacteria bacterium]
MSAVKERAVVRITDGTVRHDGKQWKVSVVISHKGKEKSCSGSAVGEDEETAKKKAINGAIITLDLDPEEVEIADCVFWPKRFSHVL